MPINEHRQLLTSEQVHKSVRYLQCYRGSQKEDCCRLRRNPSLFAVKNIAICTQALFLVVVHDCDRRLYDIHVDGLCSIRLGFI